MPSAFQFVNDSHTTSTSGSTANPRKNTIAGTAHSRPGRDAWSAGRPGPGRLTRVPRAPRAPSQAITLPWLPDMGHWTCCMVDTNCCGVLCLRKTLARLVSIGVAVADGSAWSHDSSKLDAFCTAA